jgi:hypothetical protein
LAVVVRVPWTTQRGALPCLCVLAALATPPEVSQQLDRRHKTIGMRAHQLVSLLRRWLPEVPSKRMGDLAYSILELGLHCTAQQITLIAPLRRDSVLPHPPPVRCPPTVGRPPVVGPRLPSVAPVLQDPQTVGLAAADAGLVWGRHAGRGTGYRNGLLVPLWLDSLAHSLPCSPGIRRDNGQASGKSGVLH